VLITALSRPLTGFCLFLLLALCAGAGAYSDDGAVRRDYLLIADMKVQIEATQALNDMYNFKFADAARQFRWLRQKYPEHPLPYFLMGLNEWWQVMPNLDDESHDQRFEAYMDSTIIRAERLFRLDSSRVEGAFFLSAAHGFKGRLYSERKKWLKAASSANKALNYLENCRGKEELSPELMFGDALFNYFSVWIPENYPQLKPFLIWFSRGDKQVGLEQLRTVAHNAFYTRTEAQYWLMRILFVEENDPQAALHESEYLHTTFPDNAYFHRYYARMLYSTGRLVKAKMISESLLAKLDSGMAGYEATSGRYASFFLGQIWESNMDYDKAYIYYKKALLYGEESKATDSGYYLYSLMGLARIANNTDRKDEAREYLKQVRKNSNRSHPANKQARDYIKSLKDD
jgi:tetratricopeptide (TPR) repeat protein